MSNDNGFSAPGPELPRSDEPAGEAPGEPIEGVATAVEPAEPTMRRGITPGNPGNKSRPTHGLRRLERRLRGTGIGAFNGRSGIGQLKRDWKSQIRTDLGGDLPVAKEALLEFAANTWIMALAADDYILEKGPVLRRKGTLRPVVEQRGKLVRTLRELLSSIGLERVARDADTLGDILARPPTRGARASAPAAEHDEG